MIHDEFREGNIAPATQNLEFIKACEARMPRGHVIANVRLNSAGYQAGIFNYCEDTGKTFAIGKPPWSGIACAAKCPRTASRS